MTGLGTAPKGLLDPISGRDVAGLHFYNTKPDKQFSEHAGHLTIEWGEGYRSWVQPAHRRDKLVAEIRREITEPPFPGFTKFSWAINEINSVPPTWQAALRAVKGVYLLVCEETGKQYDGSAKGNDSLWGRFVDYATTGHGGNVELKRRGPKPYRVTVLKVVNSDADIGEMEEAWKQKLMSQGFGLNEN